MEKLTLSDIPYVILQAGGRGSRMGKYTYNKPKCLLKINNETLLDRTLSVFQDKQVIIIGDYQYQTLEAYLKLSNWTNWQLIKSQEPTTASGIETAAALIPPNTPFIVSWCDLWWTAAPEFSCTTELNVGVTNQFPCRWSFQQGQLVPQPTSTTGVAGFFVFRDNSKFHDVPVDQSLVRGFLSKWDTTQVSGFELTNCVEIGNAAVYEQLSQDRNRWFNDVKITSHTVEKTARDPKYQKLLDSEILWYTALQNSTVNVPRLLNTSPLTLSRISGSHPWEATQDKADIVTAISDQLTQLHQITQQESTSSDCWQMYQNKPFARMKTVANLIPLFKNSELRINGEQCLNPIYQMELFQKFTVDSVPQEFTMIHGDPTFSNTLIDSEGSAWLFDPRGEFGNQKLLGDPAYDWAKLYYSVMGNYDSLSKQQFSVKIHESEVSISIQSQGFCDLESLILERSQVPLQKLLFLNCGIWLSLTAWALPDIDSVLYAWYKGVQTWNHLLKMT